MEFPIAVLAFGVLLLLVGLVGGDLSYRGFVVPKVGPLPRFTTTLAGFVFIFLSLVVYAAEVSLPSDTSVTGTTSAAATLPEPAPVEQAPAEAPVEQVPDEPIVVTVVDHLADWQAAEQVELAVDGTYVGGLAVDVDEPTASLEVPLDGPGAMTYEVSVEGVTLLGESYSAQGAATVEVDDGVTLFLQLDADTGEAGLVHEAAVE